MVRTPGEADATDSGNADSCRTNGRSVDMRSVDVCSTSADGASSYAAAEERSNRSEVFPKRIVLL